MKRKRIIKRIIVNFDIDLLMIEIWDSRIYSQWTDKLTSFVYEKLSNETISAENTEMKDNILFEKL